MADAKKKVIHLKVAERTGDIPEDVRTDILRWSNRVHDGEVRSIAVVGLDTSGNIVTSFALGDTEGAWAALIAGTSWLQRSLMDYTGEDDG